MRGFSEEPYHVDTTDVCGRSACLRRVCHRILGKAGRFGSSRTGSSWCPDTIRRRGFEMQSSASGPIGRRNACRKTAIGTRAGCMTATTNITCARTEETACEWKLKWVSDNAWGKNNGRTRNGFVRSRVDRIDSKPAAACRRLDRPAVRIATQSDAARLDGRGADRT